MSAEVEGLAETTADLREFTHEVGQLRLALTEVGATTVSLAARHNARRSRVSGQPVVTPGRVTIAYAGVYTPDRFTAAVTTELAPAAAAVIADGITDLIEQKGF